MIFLFKLKLIRSCFPHKSWYGRQIWYLSLNIEKKSYIYFRAKQKVSISFVSSSGFICDFQIHELEGLLKLSDDKLIDFQQQIYSLEKMLEKRDETIKEYEEKVKELAFQNAELLENVENKDKEIFKNEVSFFFFLIS